VGSTWASGIFSGSRSSLGGVAGLVELVPALELAGCSRQSPNWRLLNSRSGLVSAASAQKFHTWDPAVKFRQLRRPGIESFAVYCLHVSSKQVRTVVRAIYGRRDGVHEAEVLLTSHGHLVCTVSGGNIVGHSRRERWATGVQVHATLRYVDITQRSASSSLGPALCL
jgi:hypothetical protein